MSTFKSIGAVAFFLLALSIGALWHQSQILWTEVSLGIMMLVVAGGIGKDLERLEKRLCGPEHDEKIDEQVSRETEVYWKRLRRLEADKEKLPKINTWEIATIPNWEQYVIEQAENLRGLLGGMEAHTDVAMDYPLAYALAKFSNLKNKLELKSTEWKIKRVEVLSLMRKRDFSFKSIVDGEQELRELEKEIAALEEQLQKWEQEIRKECDSEGVRRSVGCADVSQRAELRGGPTSEK